MLDDNQFESSEFYNRRYGTFTTKLIWPIVIGLILLILFMCFTKKEIVVKSVGSIEPEKTLAVIQSPSNNPVTKNNLKEGKHVQKGDTLVEFDKRDPKNAETVNNAKLNKTTAKLAALNTFKQSVQTNQNLFNGNDNYGYADQFDDYQAQLADLQNSSAQEHADISAGNENTQKKNNDLYRANQSLTNKESSLKAKTLADINNEISNLQDTNIELNGQSKNIDTDMLNQEILAPTNGVLHVPNNKTQTKYLQSGSEIAEIYPNLTANTKLTANFYVPTDKMNGIKTGQKIRFKANQDGPKPLLLKGQITKIDSAETTTKEGSAYQVTAMLNPKKTDYKQVHYGLSGNISVITGKKTWLNYVKDLLFTSA
ncbi:multidrug efflux pump subunit AcrA (membrane-fusion protein) [Weissella uvarum]|uniref:HlyD family efflux transporter periplasmic adaptor subunit n=1 Tax=Weissella uvarum TaxID=1479233 RepID=UPI00195FB8E4|nr:HlyD family efflux transporter periplasmic adaptor subunit [Weissella uvarum]MBM7618149.1 multidrug efflux pump subunit AcrA (membrane-fusion protein) [Weissella uvarum]MCM0595233.1 HlyD family efflux transporter periplasmic adaptor subunit [Weissella uvarum]